MHYGPTLEVSLTAIARNYASISSQLKSGRAGAVVKANAYGLGAEEIGPVLYDAGCRDFFVATLDEAVKLRTVLDEEIEPRVILEDAAIYVFHGARKGQAHDFAPHRLVPVLSSLEQIEHWNNAHPWALHIDTGMNRLGIAPEEAAAVSHKGLTLVMSHLACASDPAHPKNREQLARFREGLAHFPGIPASFANSSGVALGADYHFDIARPGRALYGITRGTTFAHAMQNVVTLSAPVLQYRTLMSDQSVGYGATAMAKKGAVLATVEIGYADGFKRTLSNKAHGFAAGVRVPLLGIVSMDMVVVDVSAVPAHLRTPELRVTFIGEQQPVDGFAETAGTIGYEILTGLGSRVKRVYK